jgi:hypothetical protein
MHEMKLPLTALTIRDVMLGNMLSFHSSGLKKGFQTLDEKWMQDFRGLVGTMLKG